VPASTDVAIYLGLHQRDLSVRWLIGWHNQRVERSAKVSRLLMNNSRTTSLAADAHRYAADREAREENIRGWSSVMEGS
jgi:hypothetical protein